MEKTSSPTIKRDTHSLIGPVLILVAATLWAIDGMLRRELRSLPAITLIFFEHLIGALLLTPFFIKAVQKETLEPKKLGVIGVVSLTSSLLGTLWFTLALFQVNFISFSVVYLLQKLQPIFAISTAVILLKEKISPKYFFWAGIAMVAAYFVTFKDGLVNFATQGDNVTAALYALGAAAAWGSGTTLSKIALQHNSSVVVTSLRFFITTILAFIGVIVLGQSASFTAPTTSQLGQLLFIALSTGMVALFIYYKGLARTQVRVATILELTFPFLAILIDTYQYQTVLAVSQYIAAAVLLFAMYQIALLQKNETFS